MAKYSAFGTLFKRGATTIAQVKKISGPGLSLDTEDVTTHDSASGWEEVIPTILRSGEVSLELVYDPNLATHKNASGGIIYDLVQKTSQTYSIQFPSNPTVTWTFTAFCTKFEPSMDSSGALTATATYKLTGAPTLN